jgi:hypothetical protein
LFSDQSFYIHVSLVHACYMSSPFYPPRFNRHNNVPWRVHIMMLLIALFFAFYCCLFSLSLNILLSFLFRNCVLPMWRQTKFHTHIDCNRCCPCQSSWFHTVTKPRAGLPNLQHASPKWYAAFTVSKFLRDQLAILWIIYMCIIRNIAHAHTYIYLQNRHPKNTFNYFVLSLPLIILQQ